MDSESVEVTITLEEDDHVAFLQYYLRHHPSGRRILPNAWIFAIVAIIIYVSIQWRSPDRETTELVPFLVGMVLSSAILLGAFYVFIRFVPDLLMRSAVRLGPRKHTLEAIHFTFDRDGVQLESAQGRGRLSWNGVEGVGESEHHLFLLLGGLHAFILPKRLLGQEEELARFNAFIRAHAATPKA